MEARKGCGIVIGIVILFVIFLMVKGCGDTFENEHLKNCAKGNHDWSFGLHRTYMINGHLSKKGYCLCGARYIVQISECPTCETKFEMTEEPKIIFNEVDKWKLEKD